MRAAPVSPGQRSGLFGSVFAQLLIGSAQAQTPAPSVKSQQVSVTLDPGEGVEVKMDIKKGAKVSYDWKVDSGAVNHDTYGDGGGNQLSYSKGRGVQGDQGELMAAFDGNQGWFWRNRGFAPVTVTLTASGDFGSLKRAN
jgi:hypothetical protein